MTQFQYTGPTIVNWQNIETLIHNKIYDLDVPWDSTRIKTGRWIFFIFDEQNMGSILYDLEVNYITSTRMYYINMIMND